MSGINCEQQTNNVLCKQEHKTVLIDGATGYLGSHLAHSLSQSGLQTRCLVRDQANRLDLNFLSSTGARIFVGDYLHETSELEKSFDQVDVAVHLIGSIAPKRGESFEQIHIKQTEHFAQFCLRAKIKKIIMVTALGAAPNASNKYHSTKWLAEEVLRQSGLTCIFLRPSLLVGQFIGRRNSKLVSRLQNIIQTKRFVPLINGGTNKIQPLYILDMVEAIKKSISHVKGDSGSKSPILELGGPEIITMREFTETLMAVMNIHKPILNMPFGTANLIANLAELVQTVPILSREQVKMALSNNVCRINDLENSLGIVPHSVKEALQGYVPKNEGLVTTSV